MSKEETIKTEEKIKEAIEKAKNTIRFRGILDSLTKARNCTLSRIADMGEVDRTAVSRWVSKSAMPHEPTLRVLKKNLEKEGFDKEALMMESILNKNDGQKKQDEVLAWEASAAAANRETLPGALYTPYDAATIAQGWPRGEDMEFIFAEAKYNDRGMAWDVTHKGQNMLESFQNIQRHDYYMDILKDFGITADTIRKGALYYKNLPESAKDFPVWLREDIARDRLGSLIKKSTHWEKPVEELGNRLINMLRSLDARKSVILEKIIKDQKSGIDPEKEWWITEVLKAYDLEEPWNIMVPDIIYKLFDTAYSRKNADSTFDMKVNEAGKALLQWIDKKSGFSIKDMYDKNGELLKEYEACHKNIHDEVIPYNEMWLFEDKAQPHGLQKKEISNKQDLADAMDITEESLQEQWNATGTSGSFKKSGFVDKMRSINRLLPSLSEFKRNMYGQSGWNTDLKGFAEKYTDTDDPSNNIILGQDIALVMDDRKKKNLTPEYRRNKNILILGSSGAGKTLRYVKPNIMQMNSSYVVNDPGLKMEGHCAGTLKENGYDVKLFSPQDADRSAHYNPLDYIYDENGRVDERKVNVLVSAFLTASGCFAGDDPFWRKPGEAWMMFAILYLAEYVIAPERDFAHVLEITELGLAEGNDDIIKAIVDKAKQDRPKTACVKYYKEFKLNTKSTQKTVLTSLITTMGLLLTDNTRFVISTDYACKKFRDGAIKEYIKDKNGDYIKTDNNINLSDIGNKKSAIFINESQLWRFQGILTVILLTQMFNELYEMGKKKKLNVPVNMLLDEFGNICRIPNLEALLATTRKYGISCSIIVQSLNQIKQIYKDCWEELIANCDTTIYMGASGTDTNKYISGLLGRTTVKKVKRGEFPDLMSESLMCESEMALMDAAKEIAVIRGEAPFYVNKTAD